MEMTAPETTAQGQADDGLPMQGTTESAPEAANGQAISETQAADAGTTATDPSTQSAPQDSFFDPNDIPEDLRPAYKSMQASYTKKMQQLSEHRQKVQAYDQFMQDPVAEIQRLAQQYGYQVSAPGAAAQQKQAQPQKDWEPQTWDEVLERATALAEQKLSAKIQPLYQQYQKLQATSIEREFDAMDPQWREYEDVMRENINQHPTLANDPAKLYRLSVPEDVINTRAMQKALKQLERKTASGKVGGTSTTHKAASAPGKISSFDDAVREAKRMMAEQGR